MQQTLIEKGARITDFIEETLIAGFLGLMTLLTFANVVFRYVLNDNILWALELTVFMFAWMILVGASYGVKRQFHIGVDVVVNMAPLKLRKVYAIIAISLCLTFSILLLIGSWNYWYPFISERAWYETDDIPMPEFLQFLADWLNEGERYEKLPRFIPYAALPIGMAMLTARFAQVAYKILTGKLDRIIASHEVEDLLADDALAGTALADEPHDRVDGASSSDRAASSHQSTNRREG